MFWIPRSPEHPYKTKRQVGNSYHSKMWERGADPVFPYKNHVPQVSARGYQIAFYHSLIYYCLLTLWLWFFLTNNIVKASKFVCPSILKLGRILTFLRRVGRDDSYNARKKLEDFYMFFPRGRIFTVPPAMKGKMMLGARLTWRDAGVRRGQGAILKHY